jgi:hypothetical protein
MLPVLIIYIFYSQGVLIDMLVYTNIITPNAKDSTTDGLSLSTRLQVKYTN